MYNDEDVADADVRVGGRLCDPGGRGGAASSESAQAVQVRARHQQAAWPANLPRPGKCHGSHGSQKWLVYISIINLRWPFSQLIDDFS